MLTRNVKRNKKNSSFTQNYLLKKIKIRNEIEQQKIIKMNKIIKMTTNIEDEIVFQTSYFKAKAKGALNKHYNTKKNIITNLGAEIHKTEAGYRKLAVEL